MDINGSNASWTDMFHNYSEEIMTKMKKGQTEDAIAIGGSEFTQTQWKKVLEKIDKDLEEIQEEQKLREEKQQEKSDAQAIYQAAVAGKGNPIDNLKKNQQKVPYAALAKDGLISYNGVTFVCDAEHNSINLGDVTSDKSKVITVGLSGGGALNVNVDNLEELSKAIGMFSPEDVNRIMRAIAQYNKAKEMQQTIDDEAAGIKDVGADRQEKADKLR